MSLWKIAWRSIQQRALASVLTGISMALGVTLVVAVLVIHGIVGESFRNNSALGYNLIVGAKGGKLQLVLNTVYYLSSPVENIPYSYYKEFTTGKYKAWVDKAIPLCLGDYYKDWRVIGTTPDMFDNFEYAGGKKYEFSSGANFKHENFFDAVIGAVVARESGLEVGSKFHPSHGAPGGHQHDPFTVVGILKPTGTPNDRGLFVNMEGFYLISDHAKPEEDDDADGKKQDKHADHEHAEGTPHAHAPHDHVDHEHADHDHGVHEHEHADHDHAAHEHADDAHEHEAKPAGKAEAVSEESQVPKAEAAPDHAAGDEAAHEHPAHEHAEGDEAMHEHAGHDHADHDHAAEAHDEHAHSADEHGHDHAHGHNHGPLPESQREVTAILIRTASLPGMPPELLAPDLIKKVNKGSVAQAVLPIREIESLFTLIVDPMRVVLLALTVMIMVVSGISILVSIYNSMSDRRHEIAVMRALGAGRQTVMLIVLLESILLSLAGGLCGWLLGHALIAALNPWIVGQTGVAIGFLEFVPYESVIIPGLILLASLVGYLPAMAAYRTDVAKALTATP